MTMKCERDATRIAILFGAGVSRRGPTNLPLAADVIREIRRALSRIADVKCAATLKTGPSLELMLDAIEGVRRGTIKRLLDVFGVARPNSNHRLLAQLAVAGSWLVTTNFDRNVEHVLERELRKRVRVLRRSREARRFRAGGTSIPLLKLHGCLSRPTTIVSTTSGLFRRGSKRSVSFLSADRRKALRRFLETHVCFVLGYSGSDALDIVPALRAVRRCRIVQVDHDRRSRVAVATIRDLLRTSVPEQAGRKHWYHYQLRGNTTRFLTDLATMCGLRPSRVAGRTRTRPDVGMIRDAIGVLKRSEARRAIAEIERPGSKDGAQERLGRRYLVMLQRGVKPFVLEGGSVLFSVDPEPRRKRSRESVFELRLLSPGTRARICYGVGKSISRGVLARRGPTTEARKRQRRAARVMLGQACNVWGVLGRLEEQRRAQAALDRLNYVCKRAMPRESRERSSRAG